MKLKEGTTNTYYIDIPGTVVFSGIILALEQRGVDTGEFKQSIDITTNLPSKPGNYVVHVDWNANWQQNPGGTWCFVASIVAA